MAYYIFKQVNFTERMLHYYETRAVVSRIQVVLRIPNSNLERAVSQQFITIRQFW